MPYRVRLVRVGSRSPEPDPALTRTLNSGAARVWSMGRVDEDTVKQEFPLRVRLYITRSFRHNTAVGIFLQRCAQISKWAGGIGMQYWTYDSIVYRINALGPRSSVATALRLLATACACQTF